MSENSTLRSWKVSMKSSHKSSSILSMAAKSNSSSVVFLRVCHPPSFFPAPRPTHSLLPTVDVDDWAKFTTYRGYSVDDQIIKWFWQCVRSWPAERRSRLLHFAIGTSRIPIGGFNSLRGSIGSHQFTIEKSGDLSRLPRTYAGSNRVGGLN